MVFNDISRRELSNDTCHKFLRAFYATAFVHNDRFARRKTFSGVRLSGVSLLIHHFFLAIRRWTVIILSLFLLKAMKRGS